MELNKKYGYWTVLHETSRNAKGERMIKCRCICDTIKNIKLIYLEKGVTKSCGCKRGQLVSQTMLKNSHGMAGSETYTTWHMMRQRCENKNHAAYKNYGGRGIVVCERWKEFTNFLNDMGVRPKGTTLDRKNNNEGYSKTNCHWIPQTDQGKNTRYSKWWFIDGKKYDSLTNAALGEQVTRATIVRWCHGWFDKRNGKNHKQKPGCYCTLKYKN